ncbi:beta family protein [Streptomyces avicenniae]|uniref:beta family protein n=1 Tax=Streptomyces avicenniae TaxID=500153 RepID=UPI000AD7EADE|nr:beta family protein [Streptomyces avicenniae]
MAYVPILKGKRGELTALGRMTPDVRAGILPILEVAHGERPQKGVETFLTNARSRLPTELDVAVDCADLWRHGAVGEVLAGRPMTWIGEEFGAWPVALLPVFRADDPPEALAEVRDVQRAHGRGAVLRVDALAAPAAALHVPDALRAVDLAPEQVDLVLDAGHVSGDAAVAEALPPMLDALHRARRAPWRAVVVASGAFPQTLGNLARGDVPNRLHRWDAALWRKVASATDGGPPPYFGDYGVSHTAMPPPDRRGGIPNIRYTVGEDWQVRVARRRLPGNDDFFTIARDLLRSEHWPPRGEDTSWGDGELARCARRERPKAGNGTDWRAWTTSHHLAVVTDSLRTMDQP